MCEVRGVGPHLWLSVAEDLGFYVHTVRIKDEGFVQILSVSGVSPQLVKWGAYCKCHLDLSIVFLDVTLLSLLDKVRYWSTWLAAHVFFAATDYAFPHRRTGRYAQKYLTTRTWWAPLLPLEVGDLVPVSCHTMQACDVAGTTVNSAACSDQ